MALLRLCIEDYDGDLSRDRSHDLPNRDAQVRRELNSPLYDHLHAADVLAACEAGPVEARTFGSVLITLAATALWAGVWSHVSRRVFHIQCFRRSCAVPHRCRLSSPLAALRPTARSPEALT